MKNSNDPIVEVKKKAIREFLVSKLAGNHDYDLELVFREPRVIKENEEYYTEFSNLIWKWDIDKAKWIIDCEKSGGPPMIHEKCEYPPYDFTDQTYILRT